MENSRYKFRAWDGDTMHMGGTCYSCGSNGFNSDYKVMQYTGLKDKNGVEIYEGDIVATSNSDSAYDKWTKEQMGYAYVAISPECGVSFQTKTMNWDWDNTDESVYSLQFIEVIGNQHQNPELLDS